MKVQGLRVGYQIGFGGTFYTLWYVGKADSLGFQQADYCGKISTDKAVVEEKYPNYPFTGLKGESWIISSDPSKREVKSDIPKEERTEFWFGKYNGQPISECTDYKYMKWFHNESTYFGELPTNTYLKVIMESVGYVFHEGKIYDSVEEYKEEIAYLEITKQLYNGNTEVEFVSNVSGWDNSVRIMIDDEIFQERNEYGSTMKVSQDIELTFHDSGRYQWYTIGNVRSMKGKRALITAKDDVIIEVKYI